MLSVLGYTSVTPHNKLDMKDTVLFFFATRIESRSRLLYVWRFV
jgi:hypothetical protein